jgi:hypothetical protein
MLKKGKNSDMVVKVFLSFAVFPEDVPVPSDVFHKLATFLSGEKKDQKARLVIGGCLKQLLKFNLIKGSLLAKGDGGGAGLFMHDMVRDFVITRYTAAELRSSQEKIVEAREDFQLATSTRRISNCYTCPFEHVRRIHCSSALRSHAGCAEPR